MSPDGGLIGRSAAAYYEDFRSKMAAENMAVPVWADLDEEQATAWTLVFASTVELAARLAHASVLVLGVRNGH